jgi:hypothetical protein
MTGRVVRALPLIRAFGAALGVCMLPVLWLAERQFFTDLLNMKHQKVE